MSAQITSIEQLIAATKASKVQEAATEANLFRVAKEKKRTELAEFIETELSDVLRILGLTVDDFTFENNLNGWNATVRWAQTIDGQDYPVILDAGSGQAILSTDLSGLNYWLKPNNADPVRTLGDFMINLPEHWRKHRVKEADKAQHRLTERLNRANDVDALLAVAAAAGEDERLHPTGRAKLRKDIADRIRTIRNQERAARAQRNADLLYAAQIIELAQAYLHEEALYHNACFDWAVEWTRELWGPSELYRLRYTPVVVDGNTEHCIQEIVVLDHPSTLDEDAWRHAVTEVTSDGRTHKMWIGAFLDARPVRYEKPSITAPLMHHRHVSAQGYRVNVPADDLSPVDLAAIAAARPQQPPHWREWLQEHYIGDRNLTLPITKFPPYREWASANEIADMTPASFTECTHTNL